MKKTLVAAMVVSAAAVAAQSFAASSASDAIKQTFVALDRCLANNDAKCVGGVMADDVTFAWPQGGSKIIKSKAQVVRTLAELMGDAGPNMKGAKQTHAVENVRMIGNDHAVVDASVAIAGAKATEGEGAASPGTYHAIAVMILKGDKWLFEDLRSYVVEPPAKN